MGDYAIAQQEAASSTLAALDPETVTYTPYGGSARSIEVFLDRQPPQAIEGMGTSPTAIVRARNDVAAGLNAATLDTGGDSVTWPPKRGDSTTKSSRILSILAVDAAWITCLIG